MCDRAYDEVRRGICFLRWAEGDADDIAPSLYGGKSRRAAIEEVSKPAEPGAIPAEASALLPQAPQAAAPKPSQGQVGSPDAQPFLKVQ